MLYNGRLQAGKCLDILEKSTTAVSLWTVLEPGSRGQGVGLGTG